MEEKIVGAVAGYDGVITHIYDGLADGATTLLIQLGKDEGNIVVHTIKSFTTSGHEDGFNLCKDTITKVRIVDNLQSADNKNLIIYNDVFAGFPNLKEFIYEKNGDSTKDVKGNNGDLGTLFASTQPLQKADLSKMILMKLPNNLFKGMQKLTDVFLPSKLQEIGDYSLYRTGITSITIPEDVSSIGTRAFAYNKLNSIILNSKTLSGTSFYGQDPFYNTRGCITSVTITQLTSIPANMFHETAIVDIELPPSVETIGSHAFRACYDLQTIKFGNVKTIMPKAFKDCMSLSTVEGLENVQFIGDSCFVNTALTTVDLSNIETLEADGFACCAQLDTIILGKGLKKLGSGVFRSTPITSIDFSVCPSLTTIPFCAFEQCTNLTSVILGPNISIINSRAFFDCTSLDVSSWDFSKITKIGIQAFHNTPAYSDQSNWNNNIFTLSDCILDAQLDDTTTTISSTGSRVLADGVFANHFPATSIIIPATTKSIGNSAYFNDHKVSSLEFKGTIKEWENVQLGNNWNYNITAPLITCRDGDVISGKPEDYHLWYRTSDSTAGVLASSDYTQEWNGAANLGFVKPNEGEESSYLGGSSLTNGFFTSTNIKDVILSDKFHYIYDKALINQSNLESINLDPIWGVYAEAFSGCRKLKKAYMPECGSIGTSAFKDCTCLEDITLPAGATLGADAFTNASGIKKVQLTDEKLYSGSGYFEANSILYSTYGITVPRTLVSVDGNEIFSITLDGGYGGYAISDYAFAYCKNLKQLHLGTKVSSIGKNIFLGCDSLTTLQIDSGNEYRLTLQEGNGYSLIVKDAGISSSKVITGLVLPESTDITINSKNIEDSAFYQNSNIKQLLFTDSITVGENSFSGCKNLTAISFSYGITGAEFKENAFNGCSSLTELVIPDNIEVSHIAKDAFKDCIGLTKISLRVAERDDASIGIDPGAFDGCTSVKEINWLSRHYNVSGSDDFSDSPFYPIRDQITTFTFSTHSGARSIQKYLCYGMCQLTDITLPSYTKNIGKGAFQECTGLTNIILPKLLESIEEYVFKGCKQLESITYNGTKAQWENNIKRSAIWNEGSSINTIVCSDGSISV